MPYNPGNWNAYSTGLAAMAQGIQAGSQGIARGIEASKARRNQTKALQSLFKSVDTENPAQYDSMSLEQLQGKLQSYAVQHTLSQLEQQKQLMAQEQALGVALGRYANGPAVPTPGGMPEYAAPEAMPGPKPGSFAGQMTEAPAGLSDYVPPAPVTPGERIMYGLQTPNLGGTGGLRYLQAVTEMEKLRPKPVQMPFIPEGMRPEEMTVDSTGKATYNLTSKQPPEYLPLGTTRTLPGVGTLIGMGQGTPARFEPLSSTTKSPTAEQSNALLFANRMASANAVIEDVMKGFDPTRMRNLFADMAPNVMKSPARQKYDAAKSNWITAVLRKESGAAISKDEYVKAEREYFPQVGDAPPVIAQKAALRQLAERDIRVAAGSIGTSANAPAAVNQPPAKFQSESEARQNGAKTGDIILLYDPSSATYRRYQLD